MVHFLQRTYPGDFSLNTVAYDAGLRIKKDSVTQAAYKMGVTDIDPKINSVATKANTPVAAGLYKFEKVNKVKPPSWEDNAGIDSAIKAYTSELPSDKVSRSGYYQVAEKSRRGDHSDKLHDLWKYEPNFDGAVYRGTRLRGPQVKAYEALKEGQILSNKAPLSTSSKVIEAADFLPNQQSVEVDRLDSIIAGLGSDKESLMVTIRSKNGYDISEASSLDEAEVLIKPGTALRVIRKDETGNIKHLLLEEVELPKGAKTNTHLLQALGLVGAGTAYEQQNRKDK